LSPKSIALAKSLSKELAIPAQFVCANVYDLKQALEGNFDIIFSSYGVLHWLPNLKRWAEILAHYLKPGGTFYIVDDHPFFRALSSNDSQDLLVANPYFFSHTPDQVEMTGSYATSSQGDRHSFFIWNHPIGELVDAILGAGLVIEHLHEFPYAARAKFPFMEQGSDGWWRLPGHLKPIPFLFSLRAHKSLTNPA
jgi:SAM-dependent methyltransferase